MHCRMGTLPCTCARTHRVGERKRYTQREGGERHTHRGKGRKGGEMGDGERIWEREGKGGKEGKGKKKKSTVIYYLSQMKTFEK